MRLYHFIRDAEAVGLSLKHFDLDQEPCVPFDGQGNRIENDGGKDDDRCYRAKRWNSRVDFGRRSLLR